VKVCRSWLGGEKKKGKPLLSKGGKEAWRVLGGVSIRGESLTQDNDEGNRKLNDSKAKHSSGGIHGSAKHARGNRKTWVVAWGWKAKGLRAVLRYIKIKPRTEITTLH